jgi:gas vesicle protein GvpL/GvpF
MAAGVRAKPHAKAAPLAQSGAKVIYLYGLTMAPGPSAERFRKLEAVDGSAGVEAFPCGDLVCWISRVPRTDFADDLSKNMQDLDWLAAATVRHQRAISVIAETADILPARFGIEFLNEKSLRAHIDSRRAALQDDLKRIRGREEWGVKVFALPVVPPPPLNQLATKRLAKKQLVNKKIPSGREYLEAKSALSRRAADGRAAPDDPEVLAFARSLQSISDDVADGGKFAGARRDLQFHKTLLLKRSDRPKLERLVRSYSKKWKDLRRIECTGPWPPFSFVSRSESSKLTAHAGTDS